MSLISLRSRTVCESLGLDGTLRCHRAPSSFHPMTDQLNPDMLHSATEIKIGCSTGNSCLYLPLISDGFADEMKRGFFQVWPVRLWAENTNSLWSLPLTVLVYSAGIPWWHSWEIDLPGHVQSVQAAAERLLMFSIGFVYYRSCVPTAFFEVFLFV